MRVVKSPRLSLPQSGRPGRPVSSNRNPTGQSRRRAAFSGLEVALLLWLFLLLAVPVASAETGPVVLLLRNGDRLSGVIVAEDEKQLTLRTSWGQQLLIPADQIERREPAPKTPGEARAEAAVPPSPVPPPAAERLEPPVTPAVKPKAEQRWHGDLQLGMDVGFSEKNRQLYHARTKVTYIHDRLKNVFEYNAAYGVTDEIRSANRMDGLSKTDVDLGSERRVFVYNLAGAGYDEIRKIDFRFEVGPGLGYHLITRTNFVLNVESGVNYQEEHRTDDTVKKRYYLRFAEDLTWKVSSRLTLDEKFEFFPGTDDPGKFRLRFEANTRYWIRENLSLNLTVLDVYDTNPAHGVNRNDLQIRSSVGLKF
jgi:hypothetical protein